MKRIIVIAIALAFVLGSSREQTAASDGEGKGGATKVNIDLQWGGYYASLEQEEEQFGVFRLLDFNRYAYHVAIFKEKFSELPSLEHVMRLTPYIGHAPIDSKALLRPREIHLLGATPLTEEDLKGYRFYLEQHEMEEKDIKALLDSVIGFGNEPPLKLTLAEKDGELEITER